MLKIRTTKGVYLPAPPEGAICKRTGQKLKDMTQCPDLNFDNYGEDCVPELCDEYSAGRPKSNS